MFYNQFTARVALQVAGPQTTDISTFNRPGGGYLTVGFGPVVTYCRTPRPVITRHRAFAQALEAARGLFPAGYRAPLPARSEELPGHPVIAAITAQDDDACKLTAYTATGSHDSRPAVVLVIGALTLNIRDLVAAQDLHDVWNDALNRAPGLWLPIDRSQTVGTV